MSRGQKLTIHGRDHRLGGVDPIPGIGGPGILLPSFQPVPLLSTFDGQWTSHSGGWGISPDTASLNNATFTNRVNHSFGTARTPLQHDFFTFPVALGPKGSAWSLFGNWKVQPSGGIFKITLASVPETAGELDDSALTYLNPLVLSGTLYEDDTYQGVASYDGGSFVYSQSLVIGGADGAPFTAFTGVEPHTGYPIIDGGSGNYRWKLEVTDKFGLSTGYAVDLMNLTWARVDKTGYY